MICSMVRSVVGHGSAVKLDSLEQRMPTCNRRTTGSMSSHRLAPGKSGNASGECQVDPDHWQAMIPSNDKAMTRT